MNLPRPGQYGPILLVGAVCLSAGLLLQPLLRKRSLPKHWTPSPKKTVLPGLTTEAIAALPYPPDILPGGRDVATPYGTIRVFEWGPETGEKVLLTHGIGTPCLALSQLAERLVEKGYRVMLFDFFGRGYSDAPTGVTYDSRLYTTQILLVLASSSLPWTGDGGFHFIGYSMGGAIAMAFARYYLPMLRSLTLIASGGIIRREHVGWKSRLLYSTNWFPESFLERVVKRRLEPKEVITEATLVAEVAPADDVLQKKVSHDASGGDSFDNAVLSYRRPGMTVASVMAWQIRHHQGFVPAFMSSIRYAPIYERGELWARVGQMLAGVRAADPESRASRTGKILAILGDSDPIIIRNEFISDATRFLGSEGIEFVTLNAGHEVAITHGPQAADLAMEFWRRGRL